MSIILIVIYCLIAALLIFGLTFHDELLAEKRRKRKGLASVVNIEAGKRSPGKLHRHA
jgi:hypothetical protein